MTSTLPEIQPAADALRRRIDTRQPLLLVVDRTTCRYVGASATAEQLLGYSHSEFIALSPREVTPVEDHANLAASLATLEATGSWVGDWRLQRKDGSILYARASTSLVELPHRVLYQGLFQVASEPTPLSATLLEQLGGMCDQHSRPAFGYAYTFLQDRDAAERVVEETLLTAWRAGISAEPDAQTVSVILTSLLRRALAQAVTARRRRPPV